MESENLINEIKNIKSEDFSKDIKSGNLEKVNKILEELSAMTKVSNNKDLNDKIKKAQNLGQIYSQILIGDIKAEKDMIFEIREVFGKLVRELLCVAPIIKTLANSSPLISLDRQKSCSIFAENSAEFGRK